MARASLDQPGHSDHRRRWWFAAAVVAVVLVAGFGVLTQLRGGEGEPAAGTLAAAGMADVDYAIVGGSRVVEVGGGYSKVSVVIVQGGDLRGTGSLTRVADQVQGRRIECLGEVYDNPDHWTSTTSSTGEIDFRDAGSITLSVTIIEIVIRPLAVDPICQDIFGTYTGASGDLADVAGTLAAGIGRGRPQFWTFDPQTANSQMVRPD